VGVHEPVPEVPVPGEAEGWFPDPFGRHEQRWFSAGSPSALVRDGDTESADPPPAPTWDGSLHRPVQVDAVDTILRAGVDPDVVDRDAGGHYG
jgi:hypothetical protein